MTDVLGDRFGVFDEHIEIAIIPNYLVYSDLHPDKQMILDLN